MLPNHGLERDGVKAAPLLSPAVIHYKDICSVTINIVC